MTTLTDTEAATINKLLAVVMVIAAAVCAAVLMLCIELGQPFMNLIFSSWTR